MCDNAYTTNEQVKTRLVSTEQAGVQLVSSLANLVVLIGGVTTSVAIKMAINEVLLHQNLQLTTVSFGGAEGNKLFSCPPQTGSSRYLLISLQLLVLSIAIVTRPL